MATAIPVTSDQWNTIYDENRAIAGQEYQFGEDIYSWELDQSTGEFGLKYKRSAGDPDPTKGDIPSIPENLETRLPDAVKQPHRGGRAPIAAPVDAFSNVNLNSSGQTGASNFNVGSNNIGGYGGYGGTPSLTGAGGTGSFSPVFGEFSPQQQYSSIMSTQLPNYYTPGYQQMAQRQFQPNYGSFLLGGYGAGGGGTADQESAEQQRQNYMQTFGDWYSQKDRTAPAGIQQGWNLASELAGMQPGSEGYYRAALGRDALPLAESLQNAEDVQAMALARYYGGATPQSSYASRQASSALGNLFNRFSNRQMQQGQTSPASFVSYLNEMSPSRFGAYA